MSTLTKKTIINLCEKKNLIENCNEKNIKSSSYDLSMGNEYYIYDKKIKPELFNKMVKELGEKDSFFIPPGETCIILTEEKVNIPLNLQGKLFLRSHFNKQGVVLSSQSPIDPGYEGKIWALLYNLSNNKIEVERGQSILTIAFHELDDETERYDGDYQGLDTLKKLKITEAFYSSLDELRNELRSKRERFEATMPWLLMIITVTIGILAIIVVVLLFYLGLGTEPAKGTESIAAALLKNI